MISIAKGAPLLGVATLSLLLLTPVPVQAQTYVMPADTPSHIRRGVESPERTPEMTERDFNRKPGELLTLAGLQEGDTIAEITAFGQYFSTILAEAIGPQGRLIMYDMPYLERFGAMETGNAFAATHANTDYVVVHYSDIELPGGLDAVYNILYYHDLQPLEVDTATMNARVLAALKPGGRYVIVDHKAEDGSGWRDAATIHRMGVETIIEEVTAAGFQLELNSDLLANPEDDRSTMVFSPGVRGRTDQAVLIFRKPL